MTAHLGIPNWYHWDIACSHEWADGDTLTRDKTRVTCPDCRKTFKE